MLGTWCWRDVIKNWYNSTLVYDNSKSKLPISHEILHNDEWAWRWRRWYHRLTNRRIKIYCVIINIHLYFVIMFIFSILKPSVIIKETYRFDRRSIMSSTRQNIGAILSHIFSKNGNIAYPFGDIVVTIDCNNIPKFRVHKS